MAMAAKTSRATPTSIGRSFPAGLHGFLFCISSLDFLIERAEHSAPRRPSILEVHQACQVMHRRRGHRWLDVEAASKRGGIGMETTLITEIHIS